MLNKLLLRTSITQYLFKVALVWLLLVIFVIYFSEYLMLPLIYHLGVVTEFIAQGNDIQFEINEVKGESAVIMHATTTQSLKTVSGVNLLSKGVKTSIFSHSINHIVPIVILLSLVIAWPMKHLRSAVVMVCVAIITSIIIILITAPFQFYGIYLEELNKLAAKYNQDLHKSSIQFWQVFCDAGGVWLLAILGAWISIYLGEKQVKSH